jgi:transcriptional regulator with XRE-family HTH domain
MDYTKYEAIGARIAEARARVQMTKRSLGEAIGYSASVVTSIEAGEFALSNVLIERLATALGVTPQFLLGTATQPVSPSVIAERRIQFANAVEDVRQAGARLIAALEEAYSVNTRLMRENEQLRKELSIASYRTHKQEQKVVYNPDRTSRPQDNGHE